MAFRISDDGSVVVGKCGGPNGSESFRWTAEEGMVSLGHLREDMTVSGAEGVSADGSVIVGFDRTYGKGPAEAFIWDEVNGKQCLFDILTKEGVNLEGWRLEEANHVSADGTVIVGIGINPDGNYEAWLVDLKAVPEPAAVLVLVQLALTGCLTRRARPVLHT